MDWLYAAFDGERDNIKQVPLQENPPAEVRDISEVELSMTDEIRTEIESAKITSIQCKTIDPGRFVEHIITFQGRNGRQVTSIEVTYSGGGYPDACVTVKATDKKLQVKTNPHPEIDQELYQSAISRAAYLNILQLAQTASLSLK